MVSLMVVGLCEGEGESRGDLYGGNGTVVVPAVVSDVA